MITYLDIKSLDEALRAMQADIAAACPTGHPAQIRAALLEHPLAAIFYDDTREGLVGQIRSLC
jgi:hypothetical protein